MEVERQGEVPLEVRRRLAQKAFQHVAAYDAAIAGYLKEEGGFPQELVLSFRKIADLRYGENPHQSAAFYAAERPLPPSLALARKLGGKELSYNNILDLDSALAVVREFAEPACAIIKHNNPCGLAVPLDLATAQEMDKTHYDGILAPDFDPQTLALLGRKKDLILLAVGPLSPDGAGWELRKVAGGLLVQGPGGFPPAGV